MGRKNREKFSNLIRELANEKGFRIGFLIFTDGNVTSGFTTYKNSNDAWEGIAVLKDLLEDIEEGN